MHTIGSIALVFGLITAALLSGFVVLVWLGLRAGDHDDDARASVRLAWGKRPDGWELQAVIDVSNPSPIAALVSARSSVVAPLTLLLGEPRSVQVPFRERRTLMETTMLLGAADPGLPARWILPIRLASDAAAVRIDVRLDQHRRSRLMRHVLAVPAAPLGDTRRHGLRDPQGV